VGEVADPVLESKNYYTDPIGQTVACPSGYRVTGGGYALSTMDRTDGISGFRLRAGSSACRAATRAR
jgi:hypothetical protein